MDTFAIGNMVWNGGLVVLAGYFIRKWIRESDAKSDKNTSDIQTNAKEARVETKDAADILHGRINGIYIELKIANGRTAKLEGRIDSHIAVDAERQRNKNKGDKEK
jgi:hypothetical protein